MLAGEVRPRQLLDEPNVPMVDTLIRLNTAKLYYKKFKDWIKQMSNGWGYTVTFAFIFRVVPTKFYDALILMTKCLSMPFKWKQSIGTRVLSPGAVYEIMHFKVVLTFDCAVESQKLWPSS